MPIASLMEPARSPLVLRCISRQPFTKASSTKSSSFRDSLRFVIQRSPISYVTSDAMRGCSMRSSASASRWMVKDEDLADRIRNMEQHHGSADETKRQVIDAIREKYMACS